MSFKVLHTIELNLSINRLERLTKNKFLLWGERIINLELISDTFHISPH